MFPVIFIVLYVILFLPEIDTILYFIRYPLDDYSTPEIFDIVISLLIFMFSFLSVYIITKINTRVIAQFTLPVETQWERIKSYQRLQLYKAGRHGPTIYVKEGKQIGKPDELLSSKPGVILGDLCTAVALEKNIAPKPITEKSSSPAKYKTSRNQTDLFQNRGNQSTTSQPVRVLPPGLVFTEQGETIRGVVDLRPQIRTYDKPVQAHTRDGIEVNCTISVSFTLGQKPEIIKVAYNGEPKYENVNVIHIAEDGKSIKLIDELETIDKIEIHNYVLENPSPLDEIDNTQRVKTKADQKKSLSPFEFDPKRIFAAIYTTSKERHEFSDVNWTELPGQIAVEKFRQLLQEHYYDSLYKRIEQDNLKPKLNELKEKFNIKVRNLGVLSYQFVSRKDGELISDQDEWESQLFNIYPSQELRSPQILRMRGIKIIRAGFSELKPVDPKVKDRLLEYWSANLSKEAEFILAEMDLEMKRIITQARLHAQLDMSYSLASLLSDKNLSTEAILLGLMQNLEAVAADPTTRRLLPSDTFSLLRGLWEWIPELSKAEPASEPEVLPTSSEPSQSNGQITDTGDGTEGSSTNNDAQTEDTNTDTTLSLTD